jgi:prepilin-type N-terminal cleavage/methylation domain-containing protein
MLASSRGGRVAGFNLIELLIAVAILASAFLLVMGMFPLSFRGIHQGKHQVIAAQLAQTYMDAERTKPFTSMSNGTYTDRVPIVVNGVKSTTTYTTVVTVSPSSLNNANKAVLMVQTQWLQTEVTDTVQARSVTIESSRTRAW